MRLSPRARQVLVSIVAVLLLGGGVTIALTSGGGGGGGPSTVTINVDGPDRDAKADDPVVLTPSDRQVEQTLKTRPNDINGPYRGTEPGPALSGAVFGPVAKLQPPFASDSIPGCRTRTLRTNWSARSGPQSRVVLFWLHYTGGPDRPGSRSDVDGLTAFGNNSSAGVSWHFNMDKDGNCDYNVPLRYKAWTEAGANSSGISIEVAGTGSPPYLRPGGVAELRRIISAVHARYPAITFRLGGVRNCSPTKGGIVTHWMGGPCSGGHVDIKPFNIVSVIAQLAHGVKRPPSAHASKLCRDYAHYRRMAAADRKDGGHRLSDSTRARSVKVRAVLVRHGYRCTAKGRAVRK